MIKRKIVPIILSATLLSVIFGNMLVSNATYNILKTFEEEKTIKVNQIEDYKKSLEQEISKDGVTYNLEDIIEKENTKVVSKNKEVTKEDTVYQWRRTYVRENKSHVCPTLTASMGMGGHQVPIIHTKYGIRRLTPRECFSLQGFPTSFQLPEVSKTRLYKMIGNSVCVPVIQQIGKQIVCAIKQ